MPVAAHPHPVALARTLRGLTQEQLAKRAGVRRETVALAETGKRYPRLDTMEAIASALGLEVGDLWFAGRLTASRLSKLSA